MSRAALTAAALLAPPAPTATQLSQQSQHDHDPFATSLSSLSAGEVLEEAITVNQRALIDKILARYAAEFTVFRELLQNADDAGANSCQLRFDTRADLGGDSITAVESGGSQEQAASNSSKKSDPPDFTAPLHHWTFKNDGKVFGPDDWSRLRVSARIRMDRAQHARTQGQLN